MLRFRLKRERRRWSVPHDMDIRQSLPPSSTAVDVLAQDTAAAAHLWTLSAKPQPNSLSPGKERRPRRRRPQSLRTPRISHSSAIISSPDLVAPLHTHFPSRFNACDWQSVYSTMRDGVSLQTFYAKCAGPDPVVLVVRDGGKAVFGCYTSVAWKASNQYYGTGEGFVFKLLPELEVFKWSRANSFFQLGPSGSMAIGGGGKFALFLDSMFERGSSGPCATYNSPCLASSDQFDVIVLEAYKLVPPFKFVPEDEENNANS